MDRLDILDVDMHDSGMYKCMAYDGFTTAEAEINVTVDGECELWASCCYITPRDCLSVVYNEDGLSNSSLNPNPNESIFL